MANMFTFSMTGTEEAVRYFRTRSGRLVKIVEPAFIMAGEWVRRELVKGYDTPGDARVYRRTGTYGRKTQVRKFTRMGSITVNVYNLTPYAKWVGVSDTQAQVHRGKWPTDVKVLKKVTPDVMEAVSGALIRGLT